MLDLFGLIMLSRNDPKNLERKGSLTSRKNGYKEQVPSKHFLNYFLFISMY